MFVERSRRPDVLGGFFQDLRFAALGVIKQIAKPVREVFSATTEHAVGSSHKNWDVTSHLRSMSVDAPRQYTAEEVIAKLEPNLETFCDEYSLGLIKKKYPYKALRDTSGEIVGTSGLGGVYHEPMSALSKRFQVRLNKAGLLEQRGAIESFNGERLDLWSKQVLTDTTVPFGTKLVWCSPPGHVVEGYHGVSPKHHSFIWVYEKKEDDGGPYIEMIQYRCWPSIEQMADIQRDLYKHNQPSDRVTTLSLENNKLTARNQVIANMFELRSDVTEESIEAIIYAPQREKTWQTQRSDMPGEQMNQAQLTAFAQQRNTLLREFLVRVYRSVLSDPLYSMWLARPYSDSFWSSEWYESVVNKLDLAFSITKQSLDKWVERVIAGEDFSKANIKPAELRELFEIHQSNPNGKIDVDKARRYNTLAPTILSLGNRALSIGQCGLGTVLPVQLFQNLEKISGTQSITNIGHFGGSSVSKLSWSEKKTFHRSIRENYRQLTVFDSEGHPHTFWVMKEYHADYAGKCYQDEDRVFRGPCDVPLDMEHDEFILTDEKYHELLAESETHEFDKDAQLKELAEKEKHELKNAGSQIEKDAIRRKYARERECIQNLGSFITAMSNVILMNTPMLFDN